MSEEKQNNEETVNKYTNSTENQKTQTETNKAGASYNDTNKNQTSNSETGKSESNNNAQNNKPEENKTESPKTELQQKKEELEELTDRYKRVMAEFENYKKRAQKERESLYNMTLSDVIEAILPVMDNLENAAKAETQDESYKQGVQMVLKQLKDVLESKGVKEIPAVGETFDPSLHEAVSSVDDPNTESQKIVQEYRKGYKIGSRVIRHSMVVVAN